jgi:hypothetical protein
MALVRKPFPYSVEQRINPYPNGEDADYGTWDKALDVGRSYLVGATVPLSEFQRVYTRRRQAGSDACYKIQMCRKIVSE